MIVTVMLSFRSEVVPVTVLETWTVFPKVTFTSQAVDVMVSDDDARSVMVPVATAFVPGEGAGRAVFVLARGRVAFAPPHPTPAVKAGEHSDDDQQRDDVWLHEITP